jgi:hypothetical protein
MFNIGIGGPTSRMCNGLSRRTLLRLGGAGLFSGLTLPRLMQAETRGTRLPKAKAKACIFLFLEGGPPHQDMWDPKPDQPEEIRGPFSVISTKVPGTIFTEHCSESAKVADKFTVVRSHSHTDNGHATGYYYVMTGRRPSFADGEYPIPTNEHLPSLGSLVAKELGSNGNLPAYINVPHHMSAGGPGFLGARYAPFVIEADPSQPDFEVKDLSQLEGMSAARFDHRRKLLSALEDRQKRAGRAATMSTYYGRAYDLISSVEARKAFNIQAEDAKTRERYGLTQIGQCALLARRLVEGGCRFIGVDGPGWDVHFNCFPSLKDDLIPPADRAFAALVTDLDDRGMLDSTLVIMMGEMGRTPRVNAQAGRDHWSMAQSVLFAGGGIAPGQIIGATDRQAAAPTKDPVSINDLLYTIHTLLGIDPKGENIDSLGRPLPLVDGGKVIPGLIA